MSTINLKSNMCCSVCTKIFKKPISLPCGDSLCEEHLTLASASNETKIKCKKCEIQFVIKEHTFLPNKTLQALLDDYSYLSSDEQKLKFRMDQNLNCLESYVKKFQTLNSELVSKPNKDALVLKQTIDQFESEIIQSMENKSYLKRFFLFVFFRLLPCLFFYGIIFAASYTYIMENVLKSKEIPSWKSQYKH